MSFVPKLSALPAAQRALWPELKQVPQRFVLYGGTALALRLGHRESEDFDFFGDAPVSPDDLLRSLPVLKGAKVMQKTENTLSVTVRPEAAAVKLSFFGLTLRRVKEPEITEDGVMAVASLLDVAACKMAVIQGRAQAKDYLDIYALLNHGVTLSDALSAARAVYGEQFFPMITLRALASFRDGLRMLPKNVKDALSSVAATAEAIGDPPVMEPLPGGVSPSAPLKPED